MSCNKKIYEQCLPVVSRTIKLDNKFKMSKSSDLVSVLTQTQIKLRCIKMQDYGVCNVGSGEVVRVAAFSIGSRVGLFALFQ